MKSTNEFEGLEQDLVASMALPVPAMTFEAPGPAKGRSLRRHGRTLGFGLAIAAATLLGAFLVLPNVGGGGTETANAKELLQRSVTASVGANAVNVTHLVTVTRTEDAEMTTESWVGGPNRYRVESRTQTTDGREFVEGSSMFDDEMWVYVGQANVLTVAHGPSIYRVEPPTNDLPVEERLASWTGTGCFDAKVTGTEFVAGRSAHMIEVTPKRATCPSPAKQAQKSTIWIDEETNLPLKMVTEGPSGSTFETLSLDVDSAVPNSIFAYVPPADATVIEFKTEEELKAALAPDSGHGVAIVPRGSRVIIEHDWKTPEADGD